MDWDIEMPVVFTYKVKEVLGADLQLTWSGGFCFSQLIAI